MCWTFVLFWQNARTGFKHMIKRRVGFKAILDIHWIILCEQNHVLTLSMTVTRQEPPWYEESPSLSASAHWPGGRVRAASVMEDCSADSRFPPHRGAGCHMSHPPPPPDEGHIHTFKFSPQSPYGHTNNFQSIISHLDWLKKVSTNKTYYTTSL